MLFGSQALKSGGTIKKQDPQKYNVKEIQFGEDRVSKHMPAITEI